MSNIDVWSWHEIYDGMEQNEIEDGIAWFNAAR